jgi:hypothetical protein
VDGSHRRLPSDFGFPAVSHPHDRDGFYVIPVDPGHGRTVLAASCGLAHLRRRRDLAEADRRASRTARARGRPARGSQRGLLDPAGIYLGPAPVRSSQAATRAPRGARSPISARHRVDRGRRLAGLTMAQVHLPKTVLPLFTGCPPVVDADGATVADTLSALNARWPGLMDRLCEPGPRLRRHIRVFVGRLRPSSRRRWRQATGSTS